MAEPLFDDDARALRRKRALRREPAPFLAGRIVDEFRERLEPIRRRFDSGLVTGCPPALHPQLHPLACELHFAQSFDALASHDEGSLDLLLVMGELDSRDELPLLLEVARSRLSEGGLLMGVVPGGNGLPALREAIHAADRASGAFAARIHPRLEASALAGLLGSAGFAEPVVDIDRVRLRYGSLRRLVADLRDHGATNVLRARSRRGLQRQAFRAAEEAFLALGNGGRTEEVVELLFFTGWADGSNNRS